MLAIVQACMERKLLVNCTQGTVIRLLPAMNLTDEQADEGCDILAEVAQAAGSSRQQRRLKSSRTGTEWNGSCDTCSRWPI